MKILLNIKTDKEIKIKAKELAEELGLSLSAIINAFLKQFVRNKSVCFDAVPRMSKKLERNITKAECDLKQGKNISPPFSSPKEIKDYLSSL